jgi:hypothetical protein
MRPWRERPFEVRNLFNPAFCGLVLLRSLQGYEEEDPSGMPFSLSLLVLPLCLHKESREVLAGNSRTYLLKTIEKYPQILAGFAERAGSLLPYTLEALGFSMQHDSFTVSQRGKLQTVDKAVRKSVSGTEESVQCQRVARMVGKGFARIGDRVTIYTTLGVRP